MNAELMIRTFLYEYFPLQHFVIWTEEII